MRFSPSPGRASPAAVVFTLAVFVFLAGFGRSEKGQIVPKSEASLGGSVLLSDFVIPVDTMAPFNTGLALLNFSTGPIDVGFTLFDSLGGLVAMTSLSVPGGGQRALFVGGPGGLFPEVAEQRGKLRVTADRQIAATALRQNVVDGFPLTTIPIVPADSVENEFLLPQVADGGGAIRTLFIVTNITSAEGTVHIELHDSQGAPLTVELSNGESGSVFGLSIPSDGTLFLETSGGGDVRSGSARITSTVPVGVVAVVQIL